MLNIKNLSMSYGKHVVLNNINLELNTGLFGLLGPNGAGKSTLMKILATVQTPESGQIEFNGIDIQKDPHALRQQLGYMPQEFGGYPGVSTYALLNHLAIIKGVTNKAERKDQIEYLLHKTNLWEHRKKSTAKYSGGMKQRFGVAQALLGDPKLIIVDEPTAGLDPVERNRFYDLLSEQAKDKVVILSTHIVEDVSVLCNNMAILLKGHLVEQGEPDELLHRLDGKIFSKIVTPEEELIISKEYKIISQRLIHGKKLIHIVDHTKPIGFEDVAPTLNDVYFCHIAQPDFLESNQSPVLVSA